MLKLEPGVTLEIRHLQSGIVETGEVVRQIDRNRVVIETPGGEEKIIDLDVSKMEIVIRIIPLFKRIGKWFKKLFRKKKKK